MVSKFHNKRHSIGLFNQFKHTTWQARGAGRLETCLNKDRPDHHSTDHLKEREEGRGCGATLYPQRSEMICVLCGAVSRADLRRPQRDQAEHIWAFPSTAVPSSTDADTNTHDPVATVCIIKFVS